MIDLLNVAHKRLSARAALLPALALACTLAGVPAAQNSDDVKFYNLEKEYRPTVTFVYKVKNTGALELKQIVKDWLSIYGSLYVNEQTNELYITDVEEKIADLKKSLEGLDVDGLKAGNNLVSQLVYLKHQSVAEVADIIRHKLSAEGTIVQVPHLNAFTVTDIPSKITEVLGLLDQLDIAGPHISIEITVVEFNDEDFSRLGINVFNWLQGLGVQVELYGDNIGDLGSAGNIILKSRTEPDTRERQVLREPEKQKPLLTSARVSIVDLVGFICENANGSVLANTRIVTTNNKDASISAREILPFRYFDTDAAYQRSTENVIVSGIQMRVLPTLQEDSLINLRIVPVIADLTGWSPKGMPIVFERSLNTEVKVRDNSVFVLGGLKKRESVDVRRGVPLLKEIPVLQYLFSIKQKIVVEREVLIFIRPTTSIDPGLNADQIDALMKRYEQAKGRGGRRRGGTGALR